MRWIGLVVLLSFSVVLAPLASEGQQAGRLYQVGYLTLGSQPTQSGLWRSFLDAMRDLNYQEVRNFVVRAAFAEGRPERLPSLIASLIEAKVDVIVTTSTQETMAAKQATATIPIVMTVAPDPVEQHLVASLAHPGGNVTRLTSMAPGASQKLVELLREAVPSASRFAVVGNPGGNPETRHELQTAAQQSNVTLSFIEIHGPQDLDSALARAKKDGASGIIAPLGALTYTHRVKLVQLALQHRLPGIYWVRDYQAGGLMSYGANFGDVGRRAAYFVDKILKGAKPELIINLKTAKALGLTIPQSLLVRADEIIE